MLKARVSAGILAGAWIWQGTLPVAWSVPTIAPPREGVMRRQGSISRPGQTTDQGRESADDRQRRLESVGITPAPTPTPAPTAAPTPLSLEQIKGELVEEAKVLASSAQGPENTLKGTAAKASLDFGSWGLMRSPANSRFVPDFSWATDVLIYLVSPGLPADSGGAWSWGVGPRLLVYNGGVYVRTRDLWKRTSDVFAETAATEVGGVGVLEWERKLGQWSSTGVGFRLGYLPFRWVKALNYTLLRPPYSSDARSHFGVSYLGLEGELSASYSVIRLAEVAVFGAVHSAWPWQVRWRAGLRLSLLARQED